MDARKEKRRELADVAKQLFTAFGYKSVSMDQIVQKAGVAKGTIYLYFKDKEELLTYLFRQELSPLWEKEAQMRKQCLPILEEIHQVVYGILALRSNHRFLYKIAQEAKELKTPSACRAIKQIDDDILRYLDKRLKEAVEEGQLRPVNTTVLAFLIFKVYTALAFEWEEEHEKLDEEQIACSVQMILKDGLIIDEK